MSQTFPEWFSRNYHTCDFLKLPLDAQERIKNRFEHNTKKRERAVKQRQQDLKMDECITVVPVFHMDKREKAVARIKERVNGKGRQIYWNPNEHDKVLLEIISEKGHILSGELYAEYAGKREGKPVYFPRNFRNRLKKLKDVGLIDATGQGRDRGYSIKEAMIS